MEHETAKMVVVGLRDSPLHDSVVTEARQGRNRGMEA